MSEKPLLRNKPYTGPIQAVILDWAGTAIDFGSRGPVAVFLAAFNKFGIEPTVEEARGPMGMEKREHVKTMLSMPGINKAWQKKYGNKPSDSDVDAVFATVAELMPEVLAAYAQPVPGCVETIKALRTKNIKIGSCTGYSRPMMTKLLPAAKEAGYSPDCLVTSDEVPNGRPYPWMCWLNCMRLGVFPPESVIKVGDTIADIEEGINAGHWSVAVMDSSNALCLALDDAQTLPAEKIDQIKKDLEVKFKNAGAHYVISTITELPELCDRISERLTKGEKP